MSQDQSVIYLLCGVMSLHAIISKRHFSFYLYKDCEIQHKNFRILEKSLMIVLPLLIMCLYTFFHFHSMVIRIWMILVVLLDFALQYLAKECGWLNINKDEKISSSLMIWMVFIIALFFTIKS